MKTFISYSWDSADHIEWVRNLANELLRNGVDVIVDQYDLRIGDDRFQFMETAVRGADVVLCDCTPTYVRRANQREAGVGVETSLLTPQFFEKHRDKQFVPIVRRTDDNVPSTPDYMSALFYLDMQDDVQFAGKMEEILRHLHDQPSMKSRKLGLYPTSTHLL